MAAARTAIAALMFAATGGRALAQDDVPFITTPDRVTMAMLELAGVTARDHVLDLGSGDGRIVITAARRFGASGLGVEIVPDLVKRSREHARAAGVEGRVEFREQDLFATDLSRSTVVTMYLLPEVNLQLRPRLLALAPGTRIVSHDWDLGDWQPERTLTLDVPDKTIGREKTSRVHLWVVPAQVHGTWCAANARLVVTQRFQRFSASLERRGGGSAAATSATTTAGAPPAPIVVFDGRIDGAELRTEAPLTTPARLRYEVRAGAAPVLQIQQIGGVAAEHAGRTFTRAAASDC